jgi:hypothetical protein
MAKCTLTQRTGRDCELTHCPRGHHAEDDGNCFECNEMAAEAGYPECEECGEFHAPVKISCETLSEVADAERAAGWSAEP